MLTCLVAAAGCAESTGPDAHGEAVVEGRVEQVAPSSSSNAAATPPQPAPGTQAQSVAVVQVLADGSLLELARADVQAGGSYRVSRVPSNRDDLAVVAYVDGQIAGRVLLHERSRADAVIVAAPITYETTLEAKTYSRLRATGAINGSGSSELALLVRLDGPDAELAATSQAEAEALAEAYATADATLTAVYSAQGQTVSAATRAELVAQAAIEYAADRHGGMSASAAHEIFTEASFDAIAGAGLDARATVMATAAAATTYAASLKDASSARARLVVQPLRMSLEARTRLAAGFESGAESSVAVAVRQTLLQGRLTLLAAQTLIDVQSALDLILGASANAAVEASVSLLAGSASSTVRAQVRTRAEELAEVARLHARLSGAVTAQQAASATVGYHAAVRAAAQAMVDASGSTSVDVDALASIFIAACGGAHVD